MKTRSGFMRGVTLVCLCMLAIVCVIPLQAQFDMKSLKKKAEDVKKEIKTSGSTSGTSTGTESAPSVPSSVPSKGSDEDEERLRSLYFSFSDLQNFYGDPWGERGSAEERAKQFFDKCTVMEYPKMKQEMDAIMARNPSFMNPNSSAKDYYDKIEKEMEKFRAFVDGAHTDRINFLIEEAYKNLAAGKAKAGKANDFAQAAVLGCKGALLMLLDHGGMKKLLGDAEAAAAKMGSHLDAVYTSPFHKANAGKMVFSKHPVVITQENPSSMGTSFLASDEIYGMIYLRGNYTDVTKGNHIVNIRILIDGVERANHMWNVPADKRELTYIPMEYLPDPKTMQTQGAVKYAKAFAEASPRPHKITVRCEAEYSSNLLAEGTFDLDCSSGMEKLQERAKAMEAAKFSQVGMPKAVQSNPKLEGEMMAAMSEWKEKPIKANIIDKDWEIHRHPISGAIEYRTIRAALGMKTPQGTCRVFVLSFKQDYAGKSWGRTQHYGVGDSFDIACENINK